MRPSRLLDVLSVAALFVPSAAVAAALPPSVAASAPAGGGLGAIGAYSVIGSSKLFIRGCDALPCNAADATTSTAVTLTDPIDAAASSASVIAVGSGRRIIRVVLRSSKRPAIAWEALVSPALGSGVSVLWSGITGLDEIGEGDRVNVETSTNPGQNDVYVGHLRRELTLCGQSETLLLPKRLDPKTMTLHAVAFSRIDKAARKSAPTIKATPTTSAPLGSVLGVRGASTNDGAAVALVDDDPSTFWFETRKGDGKGEFVVFSAPRATPLEKLSLVLSPTKPHDDYAQPTVLWVLTDSATFRVEVPLSTTPGARVDVPFPSAQATTCVAIALDQAGPSAGSGDIEVGLAEVDGVPVLPASIKSLEDLVTLLDTAADIDLPRHVLANAGAKGARAIIAKLPTMGDRGKALAVDILESLPCKAASPGLARLSWDAPKKTAAIALTLLDGCGAEAKEAVISAFEAGPTAANVTFAARYARLDPKGALVALLALGPASPPARRATYRTALGRVVATTAGRDAVVEWLAAHAAEKPTGAAVSSGVDPVIELARAIAPVSDVAQPTTSGSSLTAALSHALIDHAGPNQPFDRQWLAAAPIASLAKLGDVPSLAWIRALFHNSDRYLRARAAEVSSSVDPLRPELVSALADKEPRVRERALEALRTAGGGGALSPVMGLLASDGWTFVRVAAAELLGDASTGGKDVDLALAKATSDPHKRVRSAALRSLAARHATAQLPVIRARAFDAKEVVDVRRDAIEALGKLCDRASADDLYEIAKRAGESDGAMQLALSSIMALGDIHPADLQARLTALNLSSFVMKDAVNRALKTVSTCK